MFKLSLFTLILWALLAGMSHVTMAHHSRELAWFAPDSDEQTVRGKPRLSDEELSALSAQLNEEMAVLEPMRNGLMILAAVLMVLIALRWVKQKGKLRKYDGLGVLLLGVFLPGLYSLFDAFGDYFYAANNATMDLRIGATAGLMIAVPVLFYVAYRLNRAEIHRGFHANRWISVVALGLALLTGIASAVVGLGLLFTPDLSGNIS